MVNKKFYEMTTGLWVIFRWFCPYILLMTMVIFGYAVSAQSLLYPNEINTQNFFHGILVRPILLTQKEGFLAEIFGYNFHNGTLDLERKCVPDGDVSNAPGRVYNNCYFKQF